MSLIFITLEKDLFANESLVQQVSKPNWQWKSDQLDSQNQFPKTKPQRENCSSALSQYKPAQTKPEMINSQLTTEILP